MNANQQITAAAAAQNSRRNAFDLSAIMRAAWETYRTVRYECERRALAKGFMPERFRNALRAAWADAKRASLARPRTAEKLLARITEIECSADFLTAADRDEVEALRTEIHFLSKPQETAPLAVRVRERIGARLRQMRENSTVGLSRENWQELGALRDQLRAEFSASV